MAADVEALFAHFLAEGMPEEDAAREAERRALASPAEVHRLVAVHASGPQRWLAWLSGRMRRDLDLFLFAAAVLPILALSGAVVTPEILAGGASPFLWAVLAIGAGIAGLALLKLRQLFPRCEAGLEELRAGLSGLLFLGAMAPGVAALGALWQVCSLAMRLSRAGATDDLAAAAVEIGRAATLVGSGILLAMAAGILWFLLANRVAAIERVERDFLLGE